MAVFSLWLFSCVALFALSEQEKERRFASDKAKKPQVLTHLGLEQCCHRSGIAWFVGGGRFSDDSPTSRDYTLPTGVFQQR